MNGRIFYNIFMVCGLASFFMLSSCASKNAAVEIKVHTEPEGAYIVYKQDDNPWIYLGTTPLNIIETLPTENLDEEHTLTLRAMRSGYFDQLKEWHGDELEEEIENKGMIFWTPRLIKATP